MRLFILTLTILCTGQALAGRTISCGPEETNLAEEAREYILRNYQEVIPRQMNRLLGGIDQQLLNRYERKVQSQNIRCKETNRFCSKVAGRSMGRIGNSIKICPRNLHGNFCTYVEIISHELAHAAGFPIPSLRTHNRSSGHDNDLVYEVGWAFRNHCNSSRRRR